MYNVSAEGTFEKREIKKSWPQKLTTTIKNTKCNNFLAFNTKISRV
jgi:hypothetical protein